MPSFPGKLPEFSGYLAFLRLLKSFVLDFAEAKFFVFDVTWARGGTICVFSVHKILRINDLRAFSGEF